MRTFVSTEDDCLGDGLKEICFKMYLFGIIILMLEDRAHMQTMFARLCDGVCIFIIDAFPFLSEISLFSLDVHRELLARLRTHVQVVGRDKHREREKCIRTSLRNCEHHCHMLI